MHHGLAKSSRCAPVVFWCALLLNSPLVSSQGDAGGTVSPSADLTGDGIREVIETAPALNADAGAVDVFDGATGNLVVRFVGPAGARFGWSCATEGDVTLDGAVDGADVALVVEEWGAELYLEVDPDLGTCGPETYRIEAWGESICVEVVATSTLAAELTVAVGQAAEIDPLEVIHPLANDCGDSIKCCLEEQDIKIAVQLVVERGWPPH